MSENFLDPSVFTSLLIKNYTKERKEIEEEYVRFEFPEGFAKIRLIEECRAMNALDITIPENFDLLYDIMMQMLVGKIVVIKLESEEVARFCVVDRYMDLRSVDAIDEFPVLVNWLVAHIAVVLSKKYPRSLQNYRDVMNEREERSKKLPPIKNQTQEKMTR